MTTRITIIACLLTVGTALGSDKQRDRVRRGEALFLHAWTVNDPLSGGGDGLGPLFNASSCVACHKDGGVGGSGGEDHDVDVFHVSRAVRVDPVALPLVRDRLNDLHRGFILPDGVMQRSITLHAYGVSSEYRERRRQLQSMVVGANKSAGSASPFEAMPNVTRAIAFEVTRRNTPSLFGLAKLDGIPRAKLEEIVSLQKSQGITGRVAMARNGDGVGRFGWRGQTSSIEEFVRGACANELGLQNTGHLQPVDPTRPEGPITEQADITQSQIQDMVAFIRSLPAPEQVIPDTAEGAELVEAGERVFNDVGCAVCHVKRLGDANGVFSDMLLHDMGDALYDPLPAEYETTTPTLTALALRSTPPSYYGSSVPVGTTASASAGAVPRQRPVLTTRGTTPFGVADPTTLQAVTRLGRVVGTVGISVSEQLRIASREWRTPPLWGIAETGPYLHDGRAETLSAAILAHGGEGRASRAAFLELEPAQRLAILAFLGSLKGPRIE